MDEQGEGQFLEQGCGEDLREVRAEPGSGHESAAEYMRRPGVETSEKTFLRQCHARCNR